MTAPLPGEEVIAERLRISFTNNTRRRRSKVLVLDRTQFNAAAGRGKVEDTVFVKVVRRLWRSRIRLLRYEGCYVLIDEESLAAAPSPSKREVAAWKRANRAEIAWPFPV